MRITGVVVDSEGSELLAGTEIFEEGPSEIEDITASRRVSYVGMVEIGATDAGGGPEGRDFLLGGPVVPTDLRPFLFAPCGDWIIEDDELTISLRLPPPQSYVCQVDDGKMRI